jgi:hypothetical protein
VFWEWLLAAVLAVELLAAMWLTRHQSFLPRERGTPMSRPPVMPRRDDTFDAGQYGTLRYDFKKFGGVQGIIPDPSDEQIEAFMRRLREIAKEFGADDAEDLDLDNATAEELSALLEDDSNLRIAEAQQTLCDAYGELCQGSPDATALLALPLRVRQGFMQWLQRKLLSPEASAADTGASPARRIGG